MNLFSLAKQFPTEEHALAYWMKTRWPNGVRCLACECAKVYLIETTGKTGKVARLFECSDCGLHFSATTNTLFHDSHLPLQKWFAAIAIMVEAKKGISAAQMKRHIGVTYKTAWYVCHRIREAMQESANLMLGDGAKTVEIDEAFVGGKARGKGYRGTKGKTVVLGIAERNGRIHLQTVKSRGKEHIKPVIDEKLSANARKVVTDSAPVYNWTIPAGKHVETNHREELKTKNWVSTYTVENAFSLFKRGIVGNYHKLSVQHLDRVVSRVFRTFDLSWDLGRLLG
jgi:transposase-like protein